MANSTRPIIHGRQSSYKKRGCRCAACTAANADTARRYRSGRKSKDGKSYRPPSRPLMDRVPCVICTSPTYRRWEKLGPGPSYCQPCGQAARRRMATIRRRAVAKAAASAAGTKGSASWGFTHGPCDRCGEVFTRQGTPTRYCSPECRGLDAKKGTRSWISRAGRESVHERDGWTCQICGSLVERDVSPASDWFPSLDHIEPRAVALIPDHSPMNLRTTHRWCNSMRSDDRLTDEQVRRMREERFVCQ